MAMEDSTLVIKVKHGGDCLRRFHASVVDDKLDLSMAKLREKICILFNFATDTELTLTYIDEDGETVTLADDDDLQDVVKQGLDPLRITVTLNAEKNSSPFICSTGSSTPLSSPRVQQPFQNLNSGVSEVLKTIPDPLRETLAKLDLMSKGSSSARGMPPGAAEIVEYFSKVGLSCLSQISEPQTRPRPSALNDIPESSATVIENKDSDLSKVDPTPLKAQSQGGSKKQVSNNSENSEKLKSAATMNVDEVKVKSASGGIMEALSSKAPGEVNKAGGPHLGLNPAFAGAHDLMKGDPLDGRTKHKFPCDFGSSQHSLSVPNPGSFSNFPGSYFSPVLARKYPLSGAPVENISAAQPQPTSQAVSFGRNRSQNHGNGTMEKYNDYNRIDLPAMHPHQRPSKELHDFHAQGQCSSVSQGHRGMEVNPGASKLDSCFILDVTMIDGTIITPVTPFTKIWRMRNNGTAAWPEKTKLVWIGGNMLSNAISVELQVPAAGLAVNQELDVAVDFISPHLPGWYDSHWRMAAPSGQKFGQHVWVQIQVDATIGGTQHGVHNVLTGPKINNAVMDPLLEDSHPVEAFEPITPLPNIEQDMKFPMADSSMVGSGATNLAPTAPSSTFHPVVDDVDQSDMASSEYPQPPYAHYPSPPLPVIFPSTSPLPYTLPAQPMFYSLPPLPPPSLLYTVPPHVFYPTPPLPPSSMIFHPHPASFYNSSPPFLYASPPPAGNTQENTEELEGMEEMEEELLMELEGMGFNEVDLNREILRLHEYDLELTVEDLCDTYWWNTSHEELQEMR